MGVCSKVTVAAAVEVDLSMYYAIKTDVWKLGSTMDSVCAVASAASTGGLLLCCTNSAHAVAQTSGSTRNPRIGTSGDASRGGLYDNDQGMLDSAAVLLPVQSAAIVALRHPISAIGATGVACVILTAFFCWLALVCRRVLDSTTDSDAEHLRSWCVLPLSLLLVEAIARLFCRPVDLAGGLCLLAVDGCVLFQTVKWLKFFAVELVLAPPTVMAAKAVHLVGAQPGDQRLQYGFVGCMSGSLSFSRRD